MAAARRPWIAAAMEKQERSLFPSLLHSIAYAPGTSKKVQQMLDFFHGWIFQFDPICRNGRRSGGPRDGRNGGALRRGGRRWRRPRFVACPGPAPGLHRLPDR